MKKLNLLPLIAIMLTGIFLLKNSYTYGQNPACDASVPYFYIDLSNNPDSSWASPNVSRDGNCCGTSNPDRCISFDVLLSPNTAGIQIDMIGADPAGSLYYDIDCIGHYPGGTVKCITGVGPHRITFCKPGNNANIYIIRSVSKPIFPEDTSIRIGCSVPLISYGITNTNTTWNSIYPGTPGQYNSYLSSTSIASPVYTPAAGAPAYVEYEVCGTPTASDCGFSYSCDVVRIYNVAALSGTITPNPAVFCQLGPGSGVSLSATETGGGAPYSYEWFAGSPAVSVGTGSSYFASVAGSHTVVIKDKYYSAAYCPAYTTTVSVIEGSQPVVSAGSDQTICANQSSILLTGTVSNATGGMWTTSGTGTFSPGANFIETTYYPSSADIATGSVTLTLTSAGAGSGCPNTSDFMVLTIIPPLSVSIPPVGLLCNNSSVNLTANVSGGTGLYAYAWNTGATTASITAAEGVYSVQVTDSYGCQGSANITLTAPVSLSLTMSSTDATCNGCSDGAASVVVAGGTAPYNYVWNPGGQTTATTTSTLSYGVYQVAITDANGCTATGSVVVNEPRCLGFEVTTVSTDVLCNSGADGSANASVTGGTAPYQVEWSDPLNQTNLMAVNLSAGTYTVVAQDDNGCIQVSAVTINEPSSITNTFTSSNVTAIGGNNGSAVANPFGGAPGYTYLWSNGAVTQSVTSLTAGMYYLEITDDHNCVLQDSILITEPPCNNLLLSVAKNDVTCAGGNTGSAVAVVYNGQAPYSLTWSTGQTGPLVSNLSAGNYTVTYTDARNCNEFVSFTIQEPSPLSLSLVPTQPSCFGVNDGTIDASVNGGVTPYSFVWSGSYSSTAEDIANIRPGSYTLTITDDNGCSVAANTTLSYPAGLVATVEVGEPTCYGYTDGSLDATVTGGTLPYFYNWSTGATTQDITNIPAGGYSLGVSDANGCEIASTLLLGVGQPDSISAALISIDCPVPGSGQAMVNIVPQGGTAGAYQVAFDGGAYQTAGDFDALLATGTAHSLQIKDIRGCTNFSVIDFSIDSEVNISNLAYDRCFTVGTATEDVIVTVAGGDGGPYQLSVDGGVYGAAGSYTLTLSTGAVYTVTARDGKGCESEPATITLPENFDVSVSVSSNYNGAQVSCAGANDGEASISISGGTSPFNIQWDAAAGNQTTATASGLGAGVYSVIITDFNGCLISRNITISEPLPISLTASVTSNYNGYNVSCFGNNNGAALASATGGTGALSYLWSSVPAQSTPSVTNIGAGSYSVLVTDANGCNVTAGILLTEPSLLTASALVSSNYNGYGISCSGLSDGGVNLTATGGAGSNSYLWSNGATVEDLNGIGAGTYIGTVTDINGCTAVASATVSQPTGLSGTLVASTNFNGYNISCNGNTDAGANLTVSGGVAGYVYSWSNGTTTEDLTNVGAGAYSVTITDQNGCQTSNSITLTEPAALTVTLNSTSDYNGYGISCNGEADGFINVDVAGGTGVYSYLWSNGASSQDLTNTVAGTYSLTVTDNNGCNATIIETLTEAPLLSASALVTSNYNGFGIRCNGLADGSVDLTASGGAGVLVYLWNSGAATEDLSGIAAGTYNVVVTDENGCSATAFAVVSQPVALSALAAASTDYNGYNISCNGLTDGAINLSVSGGVTTYSYLWSNGSSAQDPSGLAAGIYSVLVTDVNGCTANVSATLTEPSLLVSNLASYSDFNGFGVSCYGYNDGYIDINVTGGTGMYSYLWSSGAVTQDLNSIPAGNYSVAITDNNGCSTTESVVLAEPAVFTANAVVTTNYNGFGVSCYGFTNAAIDLTITGGAGGNQTVWNNGAFTEDLSGIAAGAYAVTVTDVNGCQIADAVTVTQPLLLLTGGAASTNYNEYEISCFGNNDGAIDLTVTGGVLPYAYNWNNGSVFQDPSGLQAGTYDVTVTDNNGCTAVNSFTLSQPADIVLALNSVSNYNGYGVSCYGVADGFVDLSVTGGTGVYTYNWNNGSVLQDLFQVQAGTYTVTVTDNNGCTEVITAVVTQPAALIAVIDSVTNFNGYEVACFNGSNGYVDLGITGGVAPYSYLWDNGETTEDLSGVTAGDYSVILNDANGCFAAQVITLTEPTEILVLYSVDEPSCEGLPDAGVNVTVTGGVPAYSYQWSDGSINQNLTGVIAGPYTAVITDANACSQNLSVDIEQPNTLFVTGFVRDIFCYGDLTGAVEMTVEGGTPPYNYLWNDGSTTQNIDGLGAGIYDVMVSDQNGCNQGLAFNITQPDSLTLDLTASQKPNGHNISYHNGLDGSIDAEVTGGVLPYSFYWSNGNTGEDQLNIGAGTYTLVVTDRNGCVVSAYTILTEPLPLDMPTGITPNGDGFNDYFVINGVEAFPENNFTVFNRWGNIVYKADHYANQWNGVSQQGELLPDATYFVILEIEDGTVLTGYVDIRTK